MARLEEMLDYRGFNYSTSLSRIWRRPPFKETPLLYTGNEEITHDLGGCAHKTAHEKEVPENVAVTQEEPEGTFPTGPELGLHLMLPHRRSLQVEQKYISSLQKDYSLHSKGLTVA